MSGADDSTLAEGLAQVVAAGGLESPVVTVAGVASAGATRRTLFLDIESAGDTVQAVAQISSPKTLIGSEMTVEDEAQLVRLAEDAGVPVAAILGASNDNAMVGGPVVISRLIDGPTIPRHVIRLLEANPSVREVLIGQCGEAMARLHQAGIVSAPESLPRLDAERPAESYVTQLHKTLDAIAEPHPVLRYGINWLGKNLPSAAPSPAIIHGDFRNGNLIVNEQGLGAVLDWELAHIGDPMEDAAYLCLRTWRFGADDYPAGGFGSIEQLRSAYVGASGDWRDDAFRWWMTARTAWWGLGLAFQVDNFAHGTTSSIVHAASGRRVVELEYDLLSLIDSHITS